MIFIILSGLYALALLCFAYGVVLGLRNRKTKSPAGEPNISIVICARNEEANIDRCLDSLTKLNYPPEKVEIIVVDDHSTDATASKIAAWQQGTPAIKLLSLVGKEVLGGGGKVNALIHGLDLASGEYLFITDADCHVPAEWVRNYLNWYDERTGMVSSITILDKATPLAGAHSFEMMQLLAMSMAAINIGIPVSIIGNNLSLRKKAYEEVGGYRSIPFSVTEDVALFQTMWKSNWDVKFKANKDLLVETNPPGSFKTWWRQKQRWVVGGKSIGFMGWLILLLGYLGMVGLIGGVFIGNTTMALIAIGLKLLGDLFILLPVMFSLRTLKLLPYFPLYQLYLLFFLICVPIQYSNKKVVWKGRDYRT